MKFLFLKTVGMMNPITTGTFYGVYHSANVYPPLGLEYLGASLENDGHKVEIIDFNFENNPLECLKKSLNSSDAVGINIYSINVEYVSQIVKFIKEFDPGISIIIGGPHCIFFKKKSLYDIPYADICVIGEGEYVIRDIAKFLLGAKNLSDIHGIYYRNNKSIISGKPLKVIDNLDDLPFPARHLVDKYDYGKLNNRYIYKPKFTTMNTSRGCPFNCQFCARYGNFISNWGFRTRSVDNIIKEIQELDDKYNSIMITDDNFLSDKKRAHNIMDRLIEYGKNIDLMIEGARVDLVDRELYLKMKKANVKLIVYGIESGNQDVLDFYKKKITLDQIRKAVNLSKEMNFITVGTFILCGPTESAKHVENTIDFACSLPIDIAIFYPFQYQMGSPLWFQAVKNKKISSEEYMIPAISNRGLGNFSEEEPDKYVLKAIKRFYLRPSYLLAQVYRAFSRKDFNFLINGFNIFTPLISRDKRSKMLQSIFRYS